MVFFMHITLTHTHTNIHFYKSHAKNKYVCDNSKHTLTLIYRTNFQTKSNMKCPFVVDFNNKYLRRYLISSTCSASNMFTFGRRRKKYKRTTHILNSHFPWKFHRNYDCCILQSTCFRVFFFIHPLSHFHCLSYCWRANERMLTFVIAKHCLNTK